MTVPAVRLPAKRFAVEMTHSLAPITTTRKAWVTVTRVSCTTIRLAMTTTLTPFEGCQVTSCGARVDAAAHLGSTLDLPTQPSHIFLTVAEVTVSRTYLLRAPVFLGDCRPVHVICLVSRAMRSDGAAPSRLNPRLTRCMCRRPWVMLVLHAAARRRSFAASAPCMEATRSRYLSSSDGVGPQGPTRVLEHSEPGPVRWGPGEGGQSWKARDLAERRDRAMEYLFDASKRQPLHDGLRQQARLNEQRLRMPLDRDEESRSDASATTVMTDVLETLIDREAEAEELLSSSEIAAAQSVNRLIHEVSEDLAAELGDEAGGGADSTLHLSAEEVALLSEELFGDASASAEGRRNKLLAEWFRLRRGSRRHMGYGTLQQEERREWHPWYLKDLAPNTTS
jgi:hypothetical protein